MADNILQVSDLSVAKGKRVILENISFEIKAGETLAVIGPNGAGKTTLFRAILGLIPYAGKVVWKKGVKIGYVPQKLFIDADFPLTTLEFLRLKDKNPDKIKDAMEAVGFSPDKNLLNNRLSDLSGGELQRVLIAWSLLGNPQVLLFDEPTAGVDVVGEGTIYSMLEKLRIKKKDMDKNVMNKLFGEEVHYYEHQHKF
ncbi:MAG: hypothetical protein UV05_C0048G0005 [candidate division CPR1 bacterium GW2011_GWA2_42_17]|uniref:ABC transporter domain-containing protein n=1 Tax=candidate division CPR1 bacterium GW2011_GWA2_42_17 TaxID=1618341 RepID=A0A0G0Z027_9BACT|nr:MAG: hypothetical protein UV05_C0048G0005 [candidate division CPR1 bacterium GW2011_GWA2_42_17]